MSVDGTAEQQAIIARLSTLCGGRVYDYIPDETLLDRDEDKFVLPYLVVSFGSLTPQSEDQSIEGADQQPQIMPVIVECWGPTAVHARGAAGGVRTLLLGWTPLGDGNSSEYDLRGGGWFPGRQQGSGRPSLAMESVNGAVTINNSIPA